MVSLLAADLPGTDAHPKRLQRVLLISTYELGHQPFGLAEPIAWLRRAGHDVRALDLAVAWDGGARSGDCSDTRVVILAV